MPAAPGVPLPETLRPPQASIDASRKVHFPFSVCGPRCAVRGGQPPDDPASAFRVPITWTSSMPGEPDHCAALAVFRHRAAWPDASAWDRTRQRSWGSRPSQSCSDPRSPRRFCRVSPPAVWRAIHLDDFYRGPAVPLLAHRRCAAMDFVSSIALEHGSTMGLDAPGDLWVKRPPAEDPRFGSWGLSPRASRAPPVFKPASAVPALGFSSFRIEDTATVFPDGGIIGIAGPRNTASGSYPLLGLGVGDCFASPLEPPALQRLEESGALSVPVPAAPGKRHPV